MGILFDSQKAGYFVEDYAVTVTHAVQLTLPMNLQSNAQSRGRYPIGVIVNESRIPNNSSGNEQYLIAMAWDVDSNNKVRITCTFSASLTAQINVKVLYKD